MGKRSGRESQIERLFDLLGRMAGDATVVASVRQPAALREAVKVAVGLGLDPTPNDAAVAALRERVETFAQRLALDAHYAAQPALRPTLAQRALAAARLDGDPLADDPELLARAAEAVARRRPGAGADDVLAAEAAGPDPVTIVTSDRDDFERLATHLHHQVVIAVI